MAEGDTVLRAARRIDQALGSKEVSVSAPNPRGQVAQVERLDGRRLERAEARGKNLLLHFGDLVLHSHLGMNGSWHVHAPGAAWVRPASSAWVILRGDGAEAAQFGGPTLRLVPTSRLPSDPQLSRLGFDILAPEFDPGAVVDAMRTQGDRALGEALLDQTLIAGIGNIFKSETCFAARVDPWRPVGELDEEELRAVLTAARELMQEAVVSGRQPHAIYRRGLCPGCGGPISARGQGDANRTTYWCPSCQG